MNFAKNLWNGHIFAASFSWINHASWCWRWIPNGFLMPTYCALHMEEWLLRPVKCVTGAIWDSDLHSLYCCTKNIDIIACVFYVYNLTCLIVTPCICLDLTLCSALCCMSNIELFHILLPTSYTCGLEIKASAVVH